MSLVPNQSNEKRDLRFWIPAFMLVAAIFSVSAVYLVIVGS